MKGILFYVEDSVYKQLLTEKGSSTWREYFLPKAGLQPSPRPIGRPPTSSLDLIRARADAMTPRTSEEVGNLYGKGFLDKDKDPEE